jgi:hypothetical protein
MLNAQVLLSIPVEEDAGHGSERLVWVEEGFCSPFLYSGLALSRRSAGGELITEAARLVRSKPSMLEVCDYTKGTAGSSKQHELFISLQTRILNERTNKKLAATAQLSPMSQSGWELRESQQGSSTSAASSTAGGLSVLSFFQQ